MSSPVTAKSSRKSSFGRNSVTRPRRSTIAGGGEGKRSHSAKRFSPMAVLVVESSSKRQPRPKRSRSSAYTCLGSRKRSPVAPVPAPSIFHPREARAVKVGRPFCAGPAANGVFVQNREGCVDSRRQDQPVDRYMLCEDGATTERSRRQPPQVSRCRAGCAGVAFALRSRHGFPNVFRILRVDPAHRPPISHRSLPYAETCGTWRTGLRRCGARIARIG